MGDPLPDELPPRSPGATGSLRTFAFVALAFLATFLLVRTAGRHSGAGGRANYAWKLADLDGKPVDLASYKGRAVFLNIWATWCPPCLREMPSIARLAENPKLKGVAFLCVSNEDATAVMGYLSSHRLPMTMLVARQPPPSAFATETIPATFLIAPDGRIAKRVDYGMDWDTPETVRLLEGLAREAR